MKSFTVLALSSFLAASAAAAGGRWVQSTDKRSGLAEVRLTASGGRVLKKVPAQGAREFVPAAPSEVREAKLRDRAKYRNLAFQRLVAREIATTILDGGRLLLVQEQLVVMPPHPHDPGNLYAAEFTEWSKRAPEQNDITATLYDDEGEILWTRKYGPIGGLLPAVQPVWTPPSATPASSTSTVVKPAQ